MSAQTPVVDLEALLARVGGQLEHYFQRSQSVVSTETVSVRSFDRAMQPSGRPRRLEYEGHVEWDAAGADGVPSVRVVRELRSVNGRPPGSEDENPCLAPEAEGDDPLSVLLPARQVEFHFRRLAGRRKIHLHVAQSIGHRHSPPKMNALSCGSMANRILSRRPE